MTHPNKRIGNNFERKLVKMAEAAGFEAKRAYASDGQALGESKEADIRIRDRVPADFGSHDYGPYSYKVNVRIQAKKSKAHPEWPWKGLENVDVLVIGKNRKPPLAILPFEKLLELIR